MTKIILIRHALTDSAGKRLTGRSPGIFLNNDGKKQAETLAHNLMHIKIDAIYSSPLERAVETAVPIAKMQGLSVEESNYFLELDFGEWTNKTVEELKQEELFSLFNQYRSHTRIPGGERMGDAQQRIVYGLEEICALFPGKTVAVVSHADMIKAALLYFSGIPLDFINRIEISPASVSIMDIYEDSTRIITMNHSGIFE